MDDEKGGVDSVRWIGTTLFVALFNGYCACWGSIED